MKTQLMVFITGMALAGCGHSAMRGSVVMKVSDTEAHVCMNKGELRPGEAVRLYRGPCNTPKNPTFAQNCPREGVPGEVEKELNPHYWVVRFPAGTKFDEGDRVEASR
jgi:hypothetical protein